MDRDGDSLALLDFNLALYIAPLKMTALVHEQRTVAPQCLASHLLEQSRSVQDIHTPSLKPKFFAIFDL
jgi:hypothetical protein